MRCEFCQGTGYHRSLIRGEEPCPECHGQRIVSCCEGSEQQIESGNHLYGLRKKVTDRSRSTTRGLSTVARFRRLYVRSSRAECWLWRGPSRGNGYGALRVGKRRVMAHRFSWELRNGPIPSGMVILHTCGIPACVNPNHLQLGTHQDSADDKVRKGRQARGARLSERCARGEARYNARLTRSQVLAIIKDNRTGRVIAREYGVTPGNISQIKSGRSWKWLTAK